MSDKVRILHVIDALNPGGAQRLLLFLAGQISRENFEPCVLVLQPGLDWKDLLESMGVRVYCCQRERPSIFRPISLLTYAFRNIRDIRMCCRVMAADVIHCHLSDAEFLGTVAGRLSGVKRIFTTVHYPDLLPRGGRKDIRNLFRRRVTKLLYHRWVDCAIAVSEDVAQVLRRDFGICGEMIRIIHNGVDIASLAGKEPADDLRKALGFSRNHRILINVGRLAPPKGQVFLLEAMGRLVKQFEGVRLVLVGDGELREALEAGSASLGLTDRVVFLGNRSDVGDLLALSELFVFPSVSEGISLALLEAMAARKPVVASSIPGNEEILDHCVNAYLVPPGDSEALARGIAFLLEHPEEARRLGTRAQQEVTARFDIRETMARYEALWEEALGGASPPEEGPYKRDRNENPRGRV